MCCLCWTDVVENHSVWKTYAYEKYCVQYYTVHYVIQVLILGSWQRCLLCLLYIYTKHMYDRTLYTYTVYIYACICTHFGSHYTQCVYILAMDLGSIFIYLVIHTCMHLRGQGIAVMDFIMWSTLLPVNVVTVLTAELDCSFHCNFQALLIIIPHYIWCCRISTTE